MGLKAHDCAKLMGQKECAEFLILYETSLEMASELSEVQSKREALVAEHNELRTYFKYVHYLLSYYAFTKSMVVNNLTKVAPTVGLIIFLVSVFTGMF